MSSEIRARHLGLRVVSQSGQEEHVYCPFHDDKTASASYNWSKGLFYCHTCKTGFNIRQLVKKLKLDMEELTEAATPSILSDGQSFRIEMFEPETELMEGYPLTEEGRRYITKMRRLSDETATRHFSSTHPSYSAGVTIYPMNLDGKQVCSITRKIYENGPAKYIVRGEKPPFWPLGELDSDYGTLIFVEGVFSRLLMNDFLNKYLLIEELGFTAPIGVFSLLGSTLKPTLKDLLAQIEFERLVFLFDDDFGGEEGVRRAQKMFPFAESFVVKQELDKMTDSQLYRLLENFMPKGA